MTYVYSTLSNDQIYTIYGEPAGNDRSKGPAAKIASVYINGKANITNKVLMTPMGAVTEVSDEELKVLGSCSVFKAHLDGGFVKIEKKKADTDVVSKDMTAKDKSAPLSAKDKRLSQQGETKTNTKSAKDSLNS